MESTRSGPMAMSYWKMHIAEQASRYFIQVCRRRHRLHSASDPLPLGGRHLLTHPDPISGGICQCRPVCDGRLLGYQPRLRSNSGLCRLVSGHRTLRQLCDCNRVNYPSPGCLVFFGTFSVLGFAAFASLCLSLWNGTLDPHTRLHLLWSFSGFRKLKL